MKVKKVMVYTEDIVRALDDIDYDLSGRVRAAFTKQCLKDSMLVLHPTKDLVIEMEDTKNLSELVARITNKV